MCCLVLSPQYYRGTAGFLGIGVDFVNQLLNVGYCMLLIHVINFEWKET